MTSDCELRLGRYQEALADVEADTLLSDPPYGERTHSGHNVGVDNVNNPGADEGLARRNIEYAHYTRDDVFEFVRFWSPRVRGWFGVMSCHLLQRDWEDALNEAGRYVFTPLACVVPGSRVRLAGDGPSQWRVDFTVARPKTRAFVSWGTLPGAYVAKPGDRADSHIGGKPLGLMRAIVRDYSRPGDLIVDPCAGGATTLLAARQEGRRAIGAELDPVTYELARKRLERPYTPDMFTRLALANTGDSANDNGASTASTQGALFSEGCKKS
jgi:site-specific DNA-methyltransferase (adenine-specific)